MGDIGERGPIGVRNGAFGIIARFVIRAASVALAIAIGRAGVRMLATAIVAMR